MGIGNTTSAAAVACALFGGPAAMWTGRGSGIDDEMLTRKIDTVEASVRRVGASAPPLERLRQLGGLELVAIAGAAIEARYRSIPVVLDGFVVGSAVAPLHMVRPDALDHCIAGHRSSEPGHGPLLSRLGLQPLLELDMRLGEGSGALAAVPLLRLAAACVTDVATLDEWGVERP
jgi:nicotinate-nucleotide--dimethylbenzimidazole phosphoribosyltransferase